MPGPILLPSSCQNHQSCFAARDILQGLKKAVPALVWQRRDQEPTYLKGFLLSAYCQIFSWQGYFLLRKRQSRPAYLPSNPLTDQKDYWLNRAVLKRRDRFLPVYQTLAYCRRVSLPPLPYPRLKKAMIPISWSLYGRSMLS